MTSEGGALTSPRIWRRTIIRWIRNGTAILFAAVVLEYVFIHKINPARSEIHKYGLGHLNFGWLALGVAAEGLSLFVYALLTRTLLPKDGPSLSRVFRIDLATAAISHVVPGGAAGTAGLGYMLFTAEGVDGTTAGFVMGTQAIGSAVILNVLLWLSLVISIPLAGIHAVYVSAALLGMLLLTLVGVLVYSLIREETGAIRIVRAVGAKIPRVGADRLEGIFRQVGSSMQVFAGDPRLRKRALLWATLNWILDAASLWLMLAALGTYVDPFELFSAYGIVNVMGALPFTPGGLGTIDILAPWLLVSFGVPGSIAALGVVGWRLVNFWLPIPTGAGAYVSLRVARGSDLRAKRRALSELSDYTHREHPSMGTSPDEPESDGCAEGEG